MILNNIFQSVKPFTTGLIICLFILSVLMITAPKETSVCSIRDFGEVVMDLGNHSSFRYQNRGVLNEHYYNTVLESMNDEAIYLILSNTRTASSRIISLFTENEFNHVSLSFDYELNTLVSYNGGNKRYFPGLNPEKVDDLVKAENSSALVYRLEVTPEQKMAILNKVRNIDNEGSSYNILGLVLNKSFKPNIMYCSQFVYKLLAGAGVQYFIAENNIIKPSDFIEQDYRRSLKFCYELSF